MRLLVLLSIFSSLLFSCGGVRQMQVQVMRPARITIPAAIQSIALLNRSVPTEKNTVESVLTGELPAQDKDLSGECLRGLVETLATSSRFKVSRCEEVMNAADGKSLEFGAPLSWTVVDSLCAKYGVEALMVLEYFDTDFSIANPGATAAAAVSSVLNGSAIQARGTARSAAGFRIYVASERKIIYEDRFTYTRNWVSEANNPIDAVSKLIKKNQALLIASYETGTAFAEDIVPLYYWEARELYKGKKGDLERGERQALAKDWEGAAKTWINVYETASKSKIRAKAAFNAALAYEVLGNLELAQQWVQKAYVEGGKETALRYSDILDQRVQEQQKIDQQLSK